MCRKSSFLSLYRVFIQLLGYISSLVRVVVRSFGFSFLIWKLRVWNSLFYQTMQLLIIYYTTLQSSLDFRLQSTWQFFFLLTMSNFGMIVTLVNHCMISEQIRSMLYCQIWSTIINLYNNRTILIDQVRLCF